MKAESYKKIHNKEVHTLVEAFSIQPDNPKEFPKQVIVSFLYDPKVLPFELSNGDKVSFSETLLNLFLSPEEAETLAAKLLEQAKLAREVE